MKEITITSSVKLKFPPVYEGFIDISIIKAENDPLNEKYNLTLKDTCWEEREIEVEEYTDEYDPDTGEGVRVSSKVEKVELASDVRYRSFSYEELNTLAKLLNLDSSDFPNGTSYINELFRQGLLIMTQKECQEGISGENLGMYFSKAAQWKIKR